MDEEINEILRKRITPDGGHEFFVSWFAGGDNQWIMKEFINETRIQQYPVS